MSNVKFGKSDWSDDSTGGGEGNRTDYMKLPAGTHTVRLISARYDYGFFKVKLDSDPNVINNKSFYGDKIKVSLPLETNPFVKLGMKPKQGCYAAVINRTTGAVQVLDMSPQIKLALNNWRQKKGYKDLMGFDFDILVSPQNKSNYYSILPSIPEPLSEEDLVKKNTFDESVLERLAQPINDHETAVKWLNERRAKNGLPPVLADMTGVAASTPSSTSATDEDGDVDFTPADAASAR